MATKKKPAKPFLRPEPPPEDRSARFGDDGGPDGFLGLDPNYQPVLDEPAPGVPEGETPKG